MNQITLAAFLAVVKTCEDLPMVNLKDAQKISPPAIGYLYLVSKTNKAFDMGLETTKSGFVVRKYVERDEWVYIATGTARGDITQYLPCPGNVKSGGKP